MRDHGVSNFPNPTLTSHNGQAVAYIAPANSVLASPSSTSANKACADPALTDRTQQAERAQVTP